MVKQKKKRNKVYKGSGAAMARPAVTHISAVQRSKFGQWVFDNKRLLRAGGIVVAILVVIVLLASGIAGLL